MAKVLSYTEHDSFKWRYIDDMHWTAMHGTTGIDIKEEKVLW